MDETLYQDTRGYNGISKMTDYGAYRVVYDIGVTGPWYQLGSNYKTVGRSRTITSWRTKDVVRRKTAEIRFVRYRVYAPVSFRRVTLKGKPPRTVWRRNKRVFRTIAKYVPVKRTFWKKHPLEARFLHPRAVYSRQVNLCESVQWIHVRGRLGPTFKWYYEYQGWGLEQVMMLNADLPTAPTTRNEWMCLLATAGFYAKVKESTLMGMVWLYELHDTIKSIKHLAHVLANLKTRWLVHVKVLWRQGRKKGLGRAAIEKMIASAYLEFLFVFKQAITDMQCAMIAAANLCSQYRFRRIAKSVKESDKSTSTIVRTVGALYFHLRVDTIVQRRAVTRGYLTFNGKTSWVRQFGWHISDVLAFTWEITPYSFVIDWFLGFQTWFVSNKPDNPRAELMGVSTTYTETITKTFTIEKVTVGSAYGPLAMDQPPYSWSVNAKFVSRSINDSVPTFPVLSRDWIKLNRIAIGLSLVVQREWSKILKRKRKKS